MILPLGHYSQALQLEHGWKNIQLISPAQPSAPASLLGVMLMASLWNPFSGKAAHQKTWLKWMFRIMLAKAKEQDLSLFFTSACCFGCLHKKWLKLQRRSPSGGGDNQTANSGTFAVRRLSLGTGLGKKTSLAAHGLTQSSPHPPGINTWKNDQTFSPVHTIPKVHYGEKTHSYWGRKKKKDGIEKFLKKVLGNSGCFSISQIFGTLKLNIFPPSCFSPSVCLFKPGFEADHILADPPNPSQWWPGPRTGTVTSPWFDVDKGEATVWLKSLLMNLPMDGYELSNL